MSFTFASQASILAVCLLLSGTIAHPTHIHHHYHRRAQTELEVRSPAETIAARAATSYDLDHNGIPDMCQDLAGNQVQCLENGKWDKFNADDPPVIASSTPKAASLPTGSLPSPATFSSENGTKWTLTQHDVLKYSGYLGTKNLQGDKARSSVLNGQVVWNFGDMMCPPDVSVCGFDMGPAMYGSTAEDTRFVLNTQNIQQINDATFVEPFSALSRRSDATPANGCTQWGMDNSNVAAINETHGIVYSWEIWRSCPTLDGKNDGYQDRGLAASVVTADTGSPFPKAERVSDLIAGPDVVQQGLIGIMSDDKYVYSYTAESGNVLVGRASVTDPTIFSSASAYEYYSPAQKSWINGIPKKTDAANYNLEVTDGGQWLCLVYGTVFRSNFLNKYMMFCDIGMSAVNFHIADQPEGPWSPAYQVFNETLGYGAMVHPELSDGGSHGNLYMTYGNDDYFHIYKLDLSKYAAS